MSCSRDSIGTQISHLCADRLLTAAFLHKSELPVEPDRCLVVGKTRRQLVQSILTPPLDPAATNADRRRGRADRHEHLSVSPKPNGLCSTSAPKPHQLQSDKRAVEPKTCSPCSSSIAARRSVASSAGRKEMRQERPAGPRTIATPSAFQELMLADEAPEPAPSRRHSRTLAQRSLHGSGRPSPNVPGGKASDERADPAASDES